VHRRSRSVPARSGGGARLLSQHCHCRRDGVGIGDPARPATTHERIHGWFEEMDEVDAQVVGEAYETPKGQVQLPQLDLLDMLRREAASLCECGLGRAALRSQLGNAPSDGTSHEF
jgi:hypothetical protein